MKKVVLASSLIIIVCAFVIVGMTFALFTDSVTVTNHLKAGSLDISLVRTNLEYSIINNDGELEAVTDDTEVDFTEFTTENVFGIDNSDVVIVPGSYFDAEMEIRNSGTIAFTYSVEMKLSGVSNDLAEQLRVTVTHSDGTVTTKMLSELTEGLPVAVGTSKITDTKQSFNIKVEFVDDVVENSGLGEGEEAMDNSLAQSQTAAFDIVVVATQATAED